MSEREHTDILIIGGGFGGMNAALELDRLLRRRKLRAQVTLVSRTNFYLFTPLLAEVAAALVEPRHAANPVRRMLRRVRFVEGTVLALDPERREATFADENSRRRVFTYGHCILAPGSTTEFFGIAGLQDRALTIKSMGDAIRIRNHVVRLLERADPLPRGEREHLLTFAVVGGGLNGTEVAGELHDFVIGAVADYPNIEPRDVRMALIEARGHLAQELPREVGAYARRNLESRGVEVWLGAPVTAYHDGVLETRDGRRLRCETVIWSAGVRPSPLIAQVPGERVKGDDRLPTDEYLRVRGYDSLWAVGDSALVADPSGTGYQPPTAQHAVRQGRHTARNVAAALAGRPLAPFRYRGIGMLATLGRKRGVGQIFGLRVTGFPAWFAWRSYYLLALPRWERRIRVAFDWTLDLLFPPDIIELKVEPFAAEDAALGSPAARPAPTTTRAAPDRPSMRKAPQSRGPRGSRGR